MFGIDSSELLVIVIIAVIVIGPKDLPRALYKLGQIVGKAQGMARHFRTGIDAMVREVELEELEKKWAAQNKRIMEEHPPETSGDPEPLPAPAAPILTDEESAPMGAESAPVPQPAGEVPPHVPARPASDGPPYLAQESVRKGDAAA
ncbi:Sec-independent protein translocase protein TatB [Sphingobium sp. Sx8-8]|uniref:Sec-independent protein translocase protein TatB n=1 Tax=Sphingobium sp. Sx8-8 TaxID=2933617 RepID=UPI001F56CB63|nr:Sec-independent protein translocase protein TatB [Sphingobium sp. Sx8-8]